MNDKEPRSPLPSVFISKIAAKNKTNIFRNNFFLLFIISFLVVLTVTLSFFRFLNYSNNKFNVANAFSAPGDLVEIKMDSPSSSINTNPNENCKLGIISCTENNRKMFLGEKLLGKPAPTNKSYSSVVFGGKISGLHNFPNIFKSNENGLQLGYGTRYSGENWVSHTLGGDNLQISSGDNVEKIDTTILEDFSDISSSFSFKSSKSGKSMFSMTTIQGSPFTFIKANSNNILKIKGNGFQVKVENGIYNFNQPWTNNNFSIHSGAQITQNNDGITIDFTDLKDKNLTIAYHNDINLIPKLSETAGNFITKVAAIAMIGKEKIGTKYQFSFEKGAGKTILGLLPHQYQHYDILPKEIYSVDSLRGDQLFFETGREMIVSMPKLEMFENTPLNVLESGEIAQVNQSLEAETAVLELWGGGSYFGAKNLAKGARMIQIADSIGNITARDKIMAILKKETIDWFDSKISPGNDKNWEYDKKIGTLSANPEEFSSKNDLNDHHFHYGMQLYSAAVLAKFDPDFKLKYGNFVNLISRDIAGFVENDNYFPKLRVFDHFEGHSWASGIQNFANGNNQESTSESINAWYGLWSWGVASGNKKMVDLGKYLYSQEVNSANFYWLNNPKKESIFKKSNYKYQTASVVWGGAYTFSTWFSADPMAIKGIQYLPFTAGSKYLHGTGVANRELVEIAVISSINTRTDDWSDINSMYFAMEKGKKYKSNLELEKMSIDNGNSKSNLFSWVYFWDKMKNSTTTVNSNSSKTEFTGQGGVKYVWLNCEVENADGENCTIGSTIKPKEITKSSSFSSFNQSPISLNKSNSNSINSSTSTSNSNNISTAKMTAGEERILYNSLSAFFKNSMICQTSKMRINQNFDCIADLTFLDSRHPLFTSGFKYKLRLSSLYTKPADCIMANKILTCRNMETGPIATRYLLQVSYNDGKNWYNAGQTHNVTK